MIVVSEEAKRIVHAVSKAALPEGRSLRLDTARTSSAGAQKVAMVVVEEPEEGDETVEYAGEPLLYVSRRISAAYDGCVVEMEQTPKGVAFSIGPPMAHRNART